MADRLAADQPGPGVRQTAVDGGCRHGQHLVATTAVSMPARCPWADRLVIRPCTVGPQALPGGSVQHRPAAGQQLDRGVVVAVNRLRGLRGLVWPPANASRMALRAWRGASPSPRTQHPG